MHISIGLTILWQEQATNPAHPEVEAGKADPFAPPNPVSNDTLD